MDETVNQVATNEPEKVFNQADVDKIVGERLAREREKYAGFEELKEKASKFDELEESRKTELQKATDKVKALETELQTLKKANEVRAMREKVSQETGVPVNLLTGETEEECKSLAEAIKSYATPGYPTVKDQGELQNTPKGSTAQQFANWLNNM